MNIPRRRRNPSDDHSSWEHTADETHLADTDTATDTSAPTASPDEIDADQALTAIHMGLAHTEGVLTGFAQFGCHSNQGVRMAYAATEGIPAGIQGLLAGKETDPAVLTALASSPFTHPAVLANLASLEPTSELVGVVIAALSNACMETPVLQYFTYSASPAVNATAKMKLAQRFSGDNIV